MDLKGTEVKKPIRNQNRTQCSILVWVWQVYLLDQTYRDGQHGEDPNLYCSSSPGSYSVSMGQNLDTGEMM